MYILKKKRERKKEKGKKNTLNCLGWKNHAGTQYQWKKVKEFTLK